LVGKLGGSRLSSVVLDTNAVIAAVEGGQAAKILKGRVPLVPMTAVKEFLAKSGSIERLRSFLVASGGRVALAGEESAAAALRAEAKGMGRRLSVEDSRIAASAMREGKALVTQDKRLLNFLKSIGVPVEDF
jgi:predicted nucleic acid-binding protein